MIMMMSAMIMIMSKSESFGECPDPRCVLQRHVVQQGNVWHQAADGRAWVTVQCPECRGVTVHKLDCSRR